LRAAFAACSDTDLVALYFKNENKIEWYQISDLSFEDKVVLMIANTRYVVSKTKEQIFFFTAKKFRKNLDILFSKVYYSLPSIKYYFDFILYSNNLHNPFGDHSLSIDELFFQSFNWISKRGAMLIASRLYDGKYFHVLKYIVVFL